MEIEARDLFIKKTESLMLSKGYDLVQNDNGSFDYNKKLNTGYNQIRLLPSFYGGNSEFRLVLFLRFDDINTITNQYLPVVPSAYSHNPTFGTSLEHFGFNQESFIIATKTDIVKVVDFLINVLHDEIFNFFDNFSTLKSIDFEFNRENRPLNHFLHDAFDRPMIGSTVAALTNNPRFEYWETYYREKMKRTNIQRQEKYESLIRYLKEKILTD